MEVEGSRWLDFISFLLNQKGLATSRGRQVGSLIGLRSGDFTKSIAEFFLSLPMVGFTVMIGAKCDYIRHSICAAFRKWGDMMSFDVNSAIRHVKAGTVTELTQTT